MPDMVEKVSEALAPFFSAADCAYGEPEKAARAAIAAMREPTEAMVREAVLLPHYRNMTYREMWQTMVDAALSEDKR